jgi:uncharacterized membrane protein (DUF4010 family)
MPDIECRSIGPTVNMVKVVLPVNNFIHLAYGALAFGAYVALCRVAMDKVMHIFANAGLARVAKHLYGGLVNKHAIALGINAIDTPVYGINNVLKV